MPAPLMNLTRDDYVAVAEKLKEQCVRYGCRMVYVGKDGAIRTTHPMRPCSTRPEHEIIGVYTHATPTEHIEDDLIHWLKHEWIYEIGR